MLVMIQLLLLLAYESLWPDAWHFLSIFSGSAWLMTLLWLNFGLMINRIVQRVIFRYWLLRPDAGGCYLSCVFSGAT